MSHDKHFVILGMLTDNGGPFRLQNLIRQTVGCACTRHVILIVKALKWQPAPSPLVPTVNDQNQTADKKNTGTIPE